MGDGGLVGEGRGGGGERGRRGNVRMRLMVGDLVLNWGWAVIVGMELV